MHNNATQDLPMSFKVQGAQGGARERPDAYLPSAQTCFFSLSLPAYSSKEILKAKLLFAIHNSPTMDADVRLHNAEGWGDA
jgi:HECT-domain (ubiquitin-transferase)